mmetsp:Transcript_11950/g.34103  ORF Transcript_11950/g.34103 Transcript_11950/m.34103 type:complete len:222 (+) Transcript_11950:340-1005(+)
MSACDVAGDAGSFGGVLQALVLAIHVRARFCWEVLPAWPGSVGRRGVLHPLRARHRHVRLRPHPRGHLQRPALRAGRRLVYQMAALLLLRPGRDLRRHRRRRALPALGHDDAEGHVDGHRRLRGPEHRRQGHPLHLQVPGLRRLLLLHQPGVGGRAHRLRRRPSLAPAPRPARPRDLAGSARLHAGGGLHRLLAGRAALRPSRGSGASTIPLHEPRRHGLR